MLASQAEVELGSRIWRQFLPDADRDNRASLRQARRLVLFSLTIQFWVFLFFFFFLWAGARGCQMTAALLIVAMLANLVAVRGGMPPARGALMLCFLGWFCSTVFAGLTGGAGSPPTAWLIVDALFAVLMLDLTWGAFWTLAGAASIVGFFVAAQLGFQCPNELTAGQTAILHFVGLQGVLLTSYGFVYLLLRPYRDAIRNIESLSEQLDGVEQDLTSAEQGGEFSLSEWIKLDQRRRQLQQLLASAKLARRHSRPL